LQYSGGHIVLSHWLQPSSNLIKKSNWLTAGTLISSIACGSLNVQVRVYHQPEDPQFLGLAVPQCCSPAPTKSSKPENPVPALDLKKPHRHMGGMQD
jgi:hypothetical protein